MDAKSPPPLCSTPELVRQRIDLGREGLFYKEVLRVEAPGGPLALVRKRPASGRTRGAALLVHGFGQNRYCWHLPGRSFVNYLAEAGYDVFNLELRGHGRSGLLGSRPPRRFSDYALEDFPAAVEAVRAASGEERLFLIGHSLGGAISYAAAPLLQERVRGIVTLGGVFYYGRGIPVIRALGGLAQLGLSRAIPAGTPFHTGVLARAIRPRLGYVEPLLDAARLLPWQPGSFERPILHEYLARAFDRTSFDILNEVFGWMSRRSFGDETDFARRFFELDRPLLVLSGDRDHLNGPAGVRPAYEGSRSRDKSYLELNPKTAGGHYGHVDLILGRLAPARVWPIIRAWLDRR